MDLLKKTIEAICPLDSRAMESARERLNNLLKPPGSLGRLEDIAVQLAGISGAVGKRINKKAIVVMCADNGVTDEGISSFPNEVSTLVAGTMLQGISGVSVLSRHAGAVLYVVDIGLKNDIDDPLIIDRKIRRMTSNMARGPAMTRAEAVQAIETGIEMAALAVSEGADLLGTGEIGIGNTTTSSAVLHVLTRGPAWKKSWDAARDLQTRGCSTRGKLSEGRWGAAGLTPATPSMRWQRWGASISPVWPDVT
jgi:nicotinate-nucleotide--dimethylbenzimidazole phosphoribosyltransferase